MMRVVDAKTYVQRSLNTLEPTFRVQLQISCFLEYFQLYLIWVQWPFIRGLHLATSRAEVSKKRGFGFLRPLLVFFFSKTPKSANLAIFLCYYFGDIKTLSITSLVFTKFLCSWGNYKMQKMTHNRTHSPNEIHLFLNNLSTFAKQEQTLKKC